MQLPCSVVSTFLLGLMVLGAGTAAGQNYPVKPIRLVTSPPGGGNDFTARLIAQGLADSSLGQPVVVDNRPTNIASEVVFRAAPDGYTLLVAGSSFMIGHLLRDSPFDPVRDFSPVMLGGVSPNVVVVHPSVPVKNIKELIALAKARPGELNYGAGSPGGTQHLSVELFKSMAGVNIVYVAFKGAGPALIALIGGELHLMITGASSVETHAKAGRLRALAVASTQPSPLAPGLPTVAATGLPGYDVVGVDAVYAPAGTPVAIINRLNQEMARAINKPDVKKKFLESGTEPIGGSAEVLAAKLKSEIALWGKVIAETGIRER